MNWLVITLILLAAFGPVFWILPSKRDRRLAKMRSRARALGMQVEMTQLPDLAAEPSARVTAGGRHREPLVACAVYRLALPRPVRTAPHWRILRNVANSSGPIAGWQWDSPPVGADGYWQEVETVVGALPADALGCAAETTEVACWWRERGVAEGSESSVDILHGAMVKLAEVQRVVDAANRVADAEVDADPRPHNNH